MIPFEPSLGMGSLSSSVPTASVAPPALATPLGAPSGITAPLAGAMGGQPAPAELQCRVGGCPDSQTDWHLRMCEYHAERFLDHVHDHTRGLGRGEL